MQQIITFGVLALMVLSSLASFPLVYANRLGGEYPFAIAIPWSALFVVFGLVHVAARKKLPGGPLGKWLVAYFVAAVVSILFSKQKSFCALALLPLAVNLTMAYLVASFFDTRKNLWLARVWIATALVVSLWAAVVFLHAPGSASGPVVTFGNRNFVAVFLAVSVWISVGFFTGDEIRQKINLKGLFFCFGVMWSVLVMTVMCRSRGAILALYLVGAIMFVAKCKNLLIRFALIAGGILTVLVISDLPPIQTEIKQLIAKDVRPTIWSGTLHMIRDKPVTGHGWGSFVVEYPAYRLPEYFKIPVAAGITNHAHSEFLEITAEGGILALAAFIALLIVVGQQAVKAIRGGNLFALGLAGALLTWLIHNLVDINLRSAPNQPLFWLVMGLLVAQNRKEVATQLGEPRHEVWRDEPAHTTTPGQGNVERIIAALVAILLLILGIIRPLWSDVNYALALQSRARGDWPEAIAAYERSLKTNPYQLEILERLGYAYVRVGDLKNALQSYQSLYAIAPGYGEVNTNLGRIWMDLGKPEQALPLFRRAVELNPYDPTKRQLLEDAQRLAAQSGK